RRTGARKRRQAAANLNSIDACFGHQSPRRGQPATYARDLAAANSFVNIARLKHGVSIRTGGAGPPARCGQRTRAMKMDIRPLAGLLLFVACGAAGGATTVRVQPSNISFRSMHAACPQGTLAGISLSLGHVRIAESAGVDSDVDDSNTRSQTVT